MRDVESAIQEGALDSLHAHLLAPAAAAAKQNRQGQPTAAAAAAVSALRRVLRCLPPAGASATTCLVSAPSSSQCYIL